MCRLLYSVARLYFIYKYLIPVLTTASAKLLPNIAIGAWKPLRAFFKQNPSCLFAYDSFCYCPFLPDLVVKVVIVAKEAIEAIAGTAVQ
jgi:hypothetical protein